MHQEVFGIGFFWCLLFFVLGCQPENAYISLEKQKLFAPYDWKPLWEECRKQDEVFVHQGAERIAFYQSKIIQEPENADWYFLYGRFLGLTKDPDFSLSFFQKSLQKDPEGIWGYYGLGMYYLQKKDLFQANIYFSECLFYEENFVPALLGMAKIALDQNPSLSISYLERCIALMPQEASLQHNIGNLYFFHTKEKHKAEPYLREAARLSPQNPIYLKDLALFYFDAKKHKESIEILHKLMDVLPKGKQKQKILQLLKRMQQELF